MYTIDSRAGLENGMLGTYKSSSVDAYLNKVESEFKQLLSNKKSLELEVEDKKKRIDGLKADLQVAQEEVFSEKAKNLEIDQRAIFIIEKEREIANKAKEVEKQCEIRIADIGKKGQAHLNLINTKAQKIIQDAQTKAEAIVNESKTLANNEIDRANNVIENLKKGFDKENVELIEKQIQLADNIRAILQEVESLSYDSGLVGNIGYPEVKCTPDQVDLVEVTLDSYTAKVEEVKQESMYQEIDAAKKVNAKKVTKPTFIPDDIK